MKILREDLIQASQHGSFLSFLSKEYQSHRNSREQFKEDMGKELVTLHNDEYVDIVSEFMKLCGDNKIFFHLRFLFEKILPELNAPVRSIMKCVKHLVKEADNDMLASTPISSFQKYLIANPDRISELHSIVINEIDECFDFVTSMIVAGSQIELEVYTGIAMNLCGHESSILKERAIFALGRVNFHENQVLIKDVLQTISHVIKNTYNERLYAASLRTLFSLHKESPESKEAIVQQCKIIFQHHDPLILQEASEYLSGYYLSSKKISASLLTILIEVLLHVNPKNKGTLHQIDIGLAGLLKNNFFHEAINLIEKLLLKNEKELTIKDFDIFISDILKNNDILNSLITRWLISKQIKLGRSALDIIQKKPDHTPLLAVDTDQLAGLPDNAYFFLAKKACGWFYVNELSAASFIVSLIDSAPENEVGKIGKLLLNPLLISYPDNVKKYLEEIHESSTDKVKNVISNQLKLLDKYHQGFPKKDELLELLPTEAQREAYHRHFSREMAKAYKKASSQSIMQQIFKPIRILYGRGFIYYQHQSDNQEVRKETNMESFTYSVEPSALLFLDPHGINWMLDKFKIEGCGS